MATIHRKVQSNLIDKMLKFNKLKI
jgi:hypothetical protein